MKYPNIHRAFFLDRPNRFVAHVELNGRIETVHVKNTGRCRELLCPGAVVYLVFSENPARKTRYDLVAVEKGTLLINMDSQAPNQVFGEYLRSGFLLPEPEEVRSEFTHGDSRFDFFAAAQGHQHLIEAKGVTLEENGIARFPDAPTDRGVKHLEGLIRGVQEGYEAWICFIVQMQGMRWMEPNDQTHPAFGEVLRRGALSGVHVKAFECAVTPDTLHISREIPVRL